MRRHAVAAIPNFRGQFFDGIALPGVSLGHRAIGWPDHFVVHGVTGGTVACFDQLLGILARADIAIAARITAFIGSTVPSWCIRHHATLGQNGGKLRLVILDHIVEPLLQRIVARANTHRHGEGVLLRRPQGPFIRNRHHLQIRSSAQEGADRRLPSDEDVDLSAVSAHPA